MQEKTSLFSMHLPSTHRKMLNLMRQDVLQKSAGGFIRLLIAKEFDERMEKLEIPKERWDAIN